MNNGTNFMKKGNILHVLMIDSLPNVVPSAFWPGALSAAIRSLHDQLRQRVTLFGAASPDSLLTAETVIGLRGWFGLVRCRLTLFLFTPYPFSLVRTTSTQCPSASALATAVPAALPGRDAFGRRLVADSAPFSCRQQLWLGTVLSDLPSTPQPMPNTLQALAPLR